MLNVTGLPYFAYGSNLAEGPFLQRAPGSTKIGPAKLDDWRLTFRGVADIVPSPGDWVEGGLWWIDENGLRAIDRYEGAPNFYDRELVVVERDGEEILAFTYVMVDTDHVGLPSPWYYNVIKEGFGDFGLPVEHLEKALEQLEQEHLKKQISHYVAVGEKRLMAVLEEDLLESFEEDQRLADEAFFAGMSPATRRLFELEHGN